METLYEALAKAKSIRVLDYRIEKDGKVYYGGQVIGTWNKVKPGKYEANVEMPIDGHVYGRHTSGYDYKRLLDNIASIIDDINIYRCYKIK